MDTQQFPKLLASILKDIDEALLSIKDVHYENESPMGKLVVQLKKIQKRFRPKEFFDYEKALKFGVPEHTVEGIKAYVEDHLDPGDFGRAILSNQLTEAFGRADELNRESMFAIAQMLYNCMPVSCWGSPEKVQKWLEGEKEK